MCFLIFFFGGGVGGGGRFRNKRAASCSPKCPKRSPTKIAPPPMRTKRVGSSFLGDDEQPQPEHKTMSSNLQQRVPAFSVQTKVECRLGCPRRYAGAAVGTAAQGQRGGQVGHVSSPRRGAVPKINALRRREVGGEVLKRGGGSRFRRANTKVPNQKNVTHNTSHTGATLSLLALTLSEMVASCAKRSPLCSMR